VLEAIAVIGKPGEDWQAAIGGTALGIAAAAAGPASGAAPAAGPTPPASAPQVAATALAAAPAAGTAGPAANAIGAGGFVPVSPRARSLAAREALDAAGLAGTGPGGRVIERDVRAALENRPELSAAAKAAVRAGGAIPAVGSGLAGRVTAADVAASAAAGGAAPAGAPATAARLGSAAAASGAAISDGQTVTPIKGIRKLIADRMLQSLASTAQFTLNAGASAVRLQELRARMKASDEALGLSKVTINDLVLFAVSRVLPAYPFMNAHKVNDTLVNFERVHLGVAVDTPRGLMVPVIRNADLLSLAAISAEAKRLAVACQGGTVKPEELSGSTFTVTTLGALGVESFTPVLNVPEVAILGVCGIELKPVAVSHTAVSHTGAAKNADEGCGVVFEPHIGFSLTINHQVVDGAPAARFLASLRAAVADIDLWLAK
jgi:pyruvate dehydrogenase E2 component (dihydrolipoamide acetyltransferase)